MAKLKLTDATGCEISSVPSISGIRPVGTQILVEFLTAQEALGTRLHVGDEVKAGAPQGYVKFVGPKVDPDWGIKVGDRVLCSGNFTPCPEIKSDRMVGLVEPHCIKAILEESK